MLTAAAAAAAAATAAAAIAALPLTTAQLLLQQVQRVHCCRLLDAPLGARDGHTGRRQQPAAIY
jgi:hypothetical protein